MEAQLRKGWTRGRRMELGRPDVNSRYEVECKRTYLWIPGYTGSVILLDVFLQSVEELGERFSPSNSSWITTHQLYPGLTRLTYVSLNCLVTRSAQN